MRRPRYSIAVYSIIGIIPQTHGRFQIFSLSGNCAGFLVKLHPELTDLKVSGHKLYIVSVAERKIAERHDGAITENASA
ncbi:MAG: hypothetical protein DRP66_10545 [Planctomycetota bacterium]|nr:MAG: hypothetical protein DRP66_10545 [Planctomycetota bacterium]